MKLGPSLIGAIVGALVGVAAQIGLESSLGREATWFALVVGLLTGLGARLMAGGAIAKASFLRAGLAALVALAAIFGGSYASSELTRKKNLAAYQSAPAPPASTETAAVATATDENDPVEEETVDPTESPVGGDSGPESETPVEGDDVTTPPLAEEATAEDGVEAGESTETTSPSTKPAPSSDPARRAIGTTPERLPPQPLNVWQLLSVTVGVLAAYELSRRGQPAFVRLFHAEPLLKTSYAPLDIA